MSIETTFNPTAEPFRGFDQMHPSLPNNLPLECDDEPRRGASRANSVRFDESTMLNQPNRSTSDFFPPRTPSRIGAPPLLERSLSHRSEGRQSSSGHSVRANSLGNDTSRLMPGVHDFPVTTPLAPPPGLMFLGPVPCIIRCWLTTTFSNHSLLYAAVCSGSYHSTISFSMVQKLNLESEIVEDEGVRSIKLLVYLPEASVYQTSTRGQSPVSQLPALTVCFVVRQTEQDEKTIQIFLGSDVLRAHNADILFSQDKMLVSDDQRNKISIPLVRPEDVAAFNTLYTGPAPLRSKYSEYEGHRGDFPERSIAHMPSNKSLSVRMSPDSFDRFDKHRPPSSHKTTISDDYADLSRPKSRTSEKSNSNTIGPPSSTSSSAAKAEAPNGVWGSWRRDSSVASQASDLPFRQTRGRNMKVLKPTRSSSSRHISLSSPVNADSSTRFQNGLSSPIVGVKNDKDATPTTPWGTSNRKPAVNNPNPIGGASAFGWLNPSSQKE